MIVIMMIIVTVAPVVAVIGAPVVGTSIVAAAIVWRTISGCVVRPRTHIVVLVVTTTVSFLVGIPIFREHAAR
jgi:hypothetical protein